MTAETRAATLLAGVDPVPGVAKPDPILTVDGMRRSFGGLVAVDVEHLEIQRGVVTALIGPNGAGKTTLFNLLCGLVPLRQGSLRLRGSDIAGLSPHDRVAAGMGYVPQLQNVFADLTVEDNLRVGAYLEPKAFAERYERVTEIFPLLGERRRQRAGFMSGGERQLVAMGRALMGDPAVLLLDEPSAGLSPANQAAAFERVQQIHRSGTAIVMVEQNARRCLQICDRGYVLDHGQNAYTGTGEALLADPKVVELYLGTSFRR